MANKVIIASPKISGNRIDYSYTVDGEWKNAFRMKEAFFIEYDCDITSVPEGVSVVPLLVNLLPVAWVYDAEIEVPVCDEDFFLSVEEFKKGYIEMYPILEFKGKLTAGVLQKNRPQKSVGTLAFFSGGVDSLNTLICHAEEKPTLVTLWGSDIKLKDEQGWKRVKALLVQAANEFDVNCVTFKSSFQRIFEGGTLNNKVASIRDNWWHGLQHGICFIGHAAPVAFALGKSTVYLASSNSAADDRRIKCASDPSIDNFVRFCGVQVVHDGFELTRQMKVHNILEYSRNSGRKVFLRVCWSSTGGSNCCLCEKCWRTILAIYAEKSDPNDFGFELSEKKLRILSSEMRHGIHKYLDDVYYRPIQEAMRQNCNPKDLPKAIRWFYYADVTRLNRDTPYKMCRRQARRVMRKVASLKNQWGKRLLSKKS